jgi:hypothetical protein
MNQINQINQFDNKWEKCARLFLFNSMIDIVEMQTTLTLILNNIIDNIGDFKYRTIKVANKSVNNKVLSKSGGLEYLLACGFQVQIDESGTKVLVLPVKENDTISMQNSLEWLKVTSKSCCDKVSSSAFPLQL